MSSTEPPDPIQFPEGNLPQEESFSERQNREWAEKMQSGIDATSIQRTVDVLDLAKSRMEPLMQMAGSMRDLFYEAAQAIDKSAGAVGNMVTSTTTLNKIKQEGLGVDHLAQQAAEKNAELAARKAKAEQTFTDLLEKQGAVQLENELKRTQMFNQRSGKYHIPGYGEVDDKELRKILRNPKDDRFKATKEEALRDLTAADPPTDPRFRMKEAIGAITRGDFGSAAGELMQPFGKTKRIEEAAARARERVENPNIPGGGTGDKALMKMLPGVARLLGPAAIVGIQQTVSRGLNMYNQAADIGQGAGDGRWSGMREVLGGRAQGLRQALNPLDALTRREATMIADNIRRTGFTGKVADAWQDAVGDVIIDTGLKGEAALTAMNTAVFQLGQNANQFRDSMRDIDDIAKDTNMSVEAAAKSVQGLQLAAAKVGGQAAVTAAGPAASALMRALSPEGGAPLSIFGEGGAGAGAFTQSPEQQQLLGMQFGGLSAQDSLGAPFMQNIGKIIDGLVDWIHESFPGLSNAAKAQMFMVYGPGASYLPGMSVRDVEILLNRGGKGKVASEMAKGRARGVVEDASEARRKAEREVDDNNSRNRGPWWKKPFRTIQDISKSDESKDAGEMAYIRGLRKAMKDQDVPENLRRQILDPLTRASMLDGKHDQYGRAAEGFEEVRGRTEKLLLDFAPGTKQYFGNMETAIRTNRYNSGTGPSQGTKAVSP